MGLYGDRLRGDPTFSVRDQPRKSISSLTVIFPVTGDQNREPITSVFRLLLPDGHRAKIC
jgi:hypothetical protein